MKKLEEKIDEGGWMFEYKGNWYGEAGDYREKTQQEREQIFAKAKARIKKKIEENN